MDQSQLQRAQICISQRGQSARYLDKIPQYRETYPQISKVLNPQNRPYNSYPLKNTKVSLKLLQQHRHTPKLPIQDQPTAKNKPNVENDKR